MKMKMTPQEINDMTLSNEMTTANVVYVAIRKTVALIQHINSKGKITLELRDIEKGDLFARGGCGELHPSGSSLFKIGFSWGKIPNQDVMQYANDILPSVDDDAPIDSFLK